MEKTSGKFKIAVIIAAVVVVVGFGAARIILYNSPDTSLSRGYRFHSWGMSRRAGPEWGTRSMTEAEREAFLENRNASRSLSARHFQLFSERFKTLSENNPAALVLLCIGNLGMLSLCILGLLWLDKLAKTVNAICEGDGKKTAGAAKFLLLGIITFGIYNLLWLYMLGDRLQDNAGRYNLSFKESGTLILLWFVPGMFIMVGPFISLYIIIKNTNALSAAYIKGTK